MEELTPETPETVEVVDDKKPLLPAWMKYVFMVIGLGVIAMYLFVSGWGGYAFAYVQCGVKQPLIAYTISGGQIYYMPGDRRYSAPGEGAFFSSYYCTEPQAKAAGFLRSGP
jgi:hypothetical protein